MLSSSKETDVIVPLWCAVQQSPTEVSSDVTGSLRQAFSVLMLIYIMGI
jgi:hypothetical protein